MELINMLPPMYEENSTMKKLQGVLTVDIDDLREDFDNTIDQCFINTATDLLPRYETMYGLQTDVTKSDTFRRERIKARAKGVGTVTKKMMTDMAASYSNGEVEIAENFDDYSFVVKFMGVRGIPNNMKDLTATIEEIKPAHLAFTFEYTYITWDEFNSYNHTWDEWDALNMTWDELEVYKEAV